MSFPKKVLSLSASSVSGLSSWEKKLADWHSMADCFFRYMMDNFQTELVVMGAKVALTNYQLPFDPSKLKSFDEFHEKFGKYVLASVDQ